LVVLIVRKDGPVLRSPGERRRAWGGPAHSGSLTPSAASWRRPIRWSDSGVLSGDRVDRRAGRQAAQHAYGLFGCDPAHGGDRLLRVVCGVGCDDHVLKLKERVGRAPVSLLGRLLLDIVERRAGNPSLGERLMKCRVLNDRTARRIDEDGGRL